MKKIISMLMLVALILTGCASRVYEEGVYSANDFSEDSYVMVINDVVEGSEGANVQFKLIGDDEFSDAGLYPVGTQITIPLDAAIIDEISVENGSFTMEIQ